ncbi:Ribosomal large subunit pseudouridine synthase B [Buchnera aphidicola (Pemphigus populi)]
MNEKIQKILANAGYGSRRYIENMIRSELIFVNGDQIKIGQRFSIRNIKFLTINKNSFIFNKKKKSRILIYYKPEGYICSQSDPKKRNTVFDTLPVLNNNKWIMIGRLDLNSCGLLLFTTDGELAYRLMHPKFKIIRKYAVRVFGYIDDKKINQLKLGVYLKDGYAVFNSIECKSNNTKNKWFIVSLIEGRNREVRRIWETVQVQVNKLIRISYANIILPKNLSPGSWKYLKGTVVKNLYNLIQLKYN